MSAGIIIPQESLDRIAQARDEQSRFNQEVAITQSLAGMLGNTFQSAFEGMLNSGKVSFKGIIDGLKALIIRLIAAAAAAFALAAILGGIGIGGFSMGGGGFMKGFKELFSSMSGIPKFAKGGMVMGPTLAMLGDNASGKEAVIPFEKMGSFLSQYGTGGGGNMKVEVVGRISGEDIFFSGVNYSNNRNKIIGG
jgi:phage-related minor tail protein